MSSDLPEFRPFSLEDAQTVTTWQYTEGYSTYNISAGNAESSIRYMVDPVSAYFAVYRAHGLIGFCSIGIDGQVPGGAYDDSAIDIGAGMRPDLTGQHGGADFLRAVATFVQSRSGGAALRATIASWNTRALRAAAAAGFVDHLTFTTHDRKTFVILIRPGIVKTP